MTYLKMAEIGQQNYIMLGDAVKYEPAWTLTNAQKKKVKEMKMDDTLISMTGKSIIAFLADSESVVRWSEETINRYCEISTEEHQQVTTRLR